MKSDNTRRIINLAVILFIGTAACCGFLGIRDLFTGEARFTYLIWNIFLAWVPFILAIVVYSIVDEGNRKSPSPLIIFLILLWLMFYPNAPYIFTDFIHLFEYLPAAHRNRLDSNRQILLWYDLILNASFAWNGHFLGLISLNLIHKTLRRITTRLTAWILMMVMIGLSGFGVFLGRFLRLNSWHIFTRPMETLAEAGMYLFSFNTLAFTGAFATFIFISYLPVVYTSKLSD